MDGYSHASNLDKIGDEGWQLVSVHVRVVDYREHIQYFFQKEINDNEPDEAK